MKSYMNKMFSLEERAVAQVAINLCQEHGLREIALNLERPTYGTYIYNIFVPQTTFFGTDYETLSERAKAKADERLRNVFQNPFETDGKEHLLQWYSAVNEQCRRLIEGMPLPDRLKQQIRPWINRIALEYLTYSRKQEVLFGLTRYFIMNTLIIEDWQCDGRVDEEKVARRLLEDEQLTALQRYEIACIYCLEEHILQLWNRLTRAEQMLFLGGSKHDLERDGHGLVYLWSHYIYGMTSEGHLWSAAVFEAIYCRNYSALVVCWKKLKEPVQRKIVVDSALECLYHFQRWDEHCQWNAFLVSPLVSTSPEYIEHFTLPSFYSKMLVFFLSQMEQEQQLEFFTTAFKIYAGESVTKFLLEWPYQDDFLPTINRLWGVMPKEEYNQCLMVLVKKYTKHQGGANCNYDYRSLLGALWEETPEEYKNYVFCERENSALIKYTGRTLVCQLLQRSPFLEADQMLFKQIFRDQPREKKQMFLSLDDGKYLLLRKASDRNWCFLNWLLKECMPQEEIVGFKKRFIQSCSGFRLCFDVFKGGNVKLLEDILDWFLESDEEKTQFKEDFISGKSCFNACEALLIGEKFAVVELMLNFCLSSVENRKEYKWRFAQRACGSMLGSYTSTETAEDMLEHMDRIIAWSVDAAEETREFKKDLFSHKGIEIHHILVFTKRQWEKAELFYQWFLLSPEERKQLKWDTLFIPEVIALYRSRDLLLSSAAFGWCLTDEEAVTDFKKVVDAKYITGLEKRERLDELVSKVLEGIGEVQDETRRKGILAKDEMGKRSSVAIGDETNSPPKRPK